MRNHQLMFLALVVFSGALEIAGKSPTSTLKKVAEFDLPGPPGKRFDYLAIDADDHYLLSAHLAAGQTYVIDLRANKVVATVADTPGAEGVEYVPELQKAYTSNASDNTIGVPVSRAGFCSIAFYFLDYIEHGMLPEWNRDPSNVPVAWVYFKSAHLPLKAVANFFQPGPMQSFPS